MKGLSKEFNCLLILIYSVYSMNFFHCLVLSVCVCVMPACYLKDPLPVNREDSYISWLLVGSVEKLG